MIWFLGLITLPSAVWLLGILRWRAEARGHDSGGENRLISAVVVARNEEATIGRCLLSLLTQLPCSASEILLMDDSSSDNTLGIARSLKADHSVLQIHDVEHTSGTSSPKKQALAQAFHHSRGDRIGLTDADCEAQGGWLTSMNATFDTTTGAVMGASWPTAGTTIKERLYRWERLVANTLMASACGWGSPASACGHNLMYSREALLKVDAPVRRDLPSGDDDLTVQSIAAAGYGVRFCNDPSSVVTDLGGLRGSRWSQAARHQSVTYLYPLHWRIFFVISILANAVALVAFPLIIFHPQNLVLLLPLAGKVILETMAGALLANKLKLDISSLEILGASLFLPAWAIWRAVAAAFSRSYVWRGRRMTTAI